MVRLWERMQGQFGRRWTDQFGHTPFDAGTENLTPVGLEWNTAITGLSGDQIASGITKLVNTGARFVPAAGEFREMCFDFPPVTDCEAYMAGQAKATPFTVAVARAVTGGSWKYRHANIDKAERLVLKAYTKVKNEIMAGHLVLHELDKAIEHKPAPHVPCSDETAAEHMARIRTMLRQHPTEKKGT